MKYFFPVVCLFIISSASAQTQVCPLNSNFNLGNLTHWQAYTGNNVGGNGPSAIKEVYDSSTSGASGTLGIATIYEYNLAGVPAVQIHTGATNDPYGNFPTVPNINGYQYAASVELGSTSITRSSSGGSGGGYVRGISYRINVPPGPVTEPYTMTYAYAMVLENGTHNSAQQPLFSATLRSSDSVITCASPQYYLPTLNDARSQGTGATLDTALAESNGFYLSPLASPNANPNGTGLGAADHLRDVWAKGWTEVTFDLSPYRGRQVTLTFETDNCVPGGHFAYSYVALRNTCAGLLISGDTIACIGSTLIYSIPGLAGATYNWTIPGDWTLVSGADSNILKVVVGNSIGTVTAHELNGCADLKDTLPVKTTLPTIAGTVTEDVVVCAGVNSTVLTLGGNRGYVLNWLSSTNGGGWVPIDDTTPQYTAENLTATTSFKALVQAGQSCTIDSSQAATVLVDPRSVGGQLAPSSMEFCIGQNKDALLQLKDAVGSVVNWESSMDAVNWAGLTPVDTFDNYTLPPTLTQPIRYRVIVKSGVCPADTSSISNIDIVNVPFPQATADPADTLICYNTPATLNSVITIGTNYTWSNTRTLTGQGGGVVSGLPYTIQATATPLATTDYILSIENSGCPNLLIDTFHVQVLPAILVDAGNDTSVVVGQPLQLNASSNDTTTVGGDQFTWTPIIGLNDPNIPNPIGLYSAETDSITYLVKATSVHGCIGTAEVKVTIFKTGPDIFVPNAFTPGGATNNIFRPVPVGIATLQYFRVYNRWGQLVYSTTQMGQGWNGYQNGRPLASDTYVWMVQGVTYAGKTVFHKGTMILVR